MKVNFEQILRNFKGIPLKSADEGELTLKFAAVGSLLAIYPDEQNLPGPEKYSRYQLAQKIHAGVKDYSVEEIAKVKELIGKNYIPIIVGPSFDLLDGKELAHDLKDETELAQANAEQAQAPEQSDPDAVQSADDQGSSAAEPSAKEAGPSNGQARGRKSNQGRRKK